MRRQAGEVVVGSLKRQIERFGSLAGQGRQDRKKMQESWLALARDTTSRHQEEVLEPAMARLAKRLEEEAGAEESAMRAEEASMEEAEGRVLTAKWEVEEARVRAHMAREVEAVRLAAEQRAYYERMNQEVGVCPCLMRCTPCMAYDRPIDGP
jgi:hypothetical protein